LLGVGNGVDREAWRRGEEVSFLLLFSCCCLCSAFLDGDVFGARGADLCAEI